MPTTVSDGPGFPCMVRGVVTYGGVPVNGAHVVSSTGTDAWSDYGPTYGVGEYGVDVASGTAGQWLVATYQGHNAGANLAFPSFLPALSSNILRSQATDNLPVLIDHHRSMPVTEDRYLSARPGFLPAARSCQWLVSIFR